MGEKKKKPNNKSKSAPKNAAMIAKIREMQELKKKEEERIRLEEERIRLEEEEELRKEEEEKKKKEQERLEKAKKKEEEIAKLKREGRYMTKAQKKKWDKKRARSVITTSSVRSVDVIDNSDYSQNEIKIKE